MTGASDAAPSEDFVRLVDHFEMAVSNYGHNFVPSNSTRTARSALLTHGAQLKAEIERLTKDADHQCRQRVKEWERANKAEAEIEHLRVELAQRDEALAQAPKPIAQAVNVPEEVRALSEAATPGPWGWMIHDPSMASLTGPDDMRDHVFSVSPCENCQKRAEDWEWGRCKTPNEADADLIAKGINWIRSLLAQQTPGDAP